MNLEKLGFKNFNLRNNTEYFQKLKKQTKQNKTMPISNMHQTNH